MILFGTLLLASCGNAQQMDNNDIGNTTVIDETQADEQKMQVQKQKKLR